MRSFNFGIFILLSVLWSCKNQKTQVVPPVIDNDTTSVLNQALSDAISVRYMPDASALRHPYHFKDSILLTSKANLLKLLPTSVGGQKFKVMNKDKIIAMLSADSNNLNLPNYLILSDFEANDSGYYLQIQNLSALPYGGGGSLGLYYEEKGDSLINVKRSGGSIN